MKKYCTVFLACSLFLLVPLVPHLAVTEAYASDCLSFGPQQFTRQSGKPVAESVSFDSPNPLGGPYTLVILNGTESGCEAYRIVRPV